MKNYLIVTGGGTEIFSRILRYGGASKWFLGGFIPYSQKMTDNFLGYTLKNYNSEKAARQLAHTGFQHLINLGYNPDDISVVSVTASLRYSGERESRKHSFHTCKITKDDAFVYNVQLYEPRTREVEESIVASYVMAKCYEDTSYVSRFSQLERENITWKNVKLVSDTEYKLFYNIPNDKYQVKNFIVGTGLKENKIIYSGSFNPLHDGHRKIIEDAKSRFKEDVTLDISVLNFDKEPLDYFDYNERIDITKQEDLNISFSRAPLFIDKLHIYGPKKIYIVGEDTYLRIAKHHSFSSLNEYMHIYDSKMFIYPRSNNFRMIKGLNLDYKWLHLIADFEPMNISSTEIRNNNDASV